jgi:hypothetical protein
MSSTTVSRNRRIFASTLRGLARGIVDRPGEFRRQLVRDTWTAAKRFAAVGVQNIALRELPMLADAVVEAYVDDRQRALIAALVRGLGARTFFEIGTNRGPTTWTVARHNPELRLYTLDVAPADQPDQTTFALADEDRVYLRPADACGEAFQGTPEQRRITQLWDDYATSPGVYEALVELAPGFERPLYHLLETRMALSRRQEFVRRVAPGRFPFD